MSNLYVYQVSQRGGANSLAQLTDVTVISPTQGQALAYNEASGKWENTNISGVGGGSSEDFAQFAGGTGLYYSPFIGTSSGVTISLTANNARLSPVIIRRSCSIDRVRFNVTTAGAGVSVDILLYDSNGTFLVDFGVTNADTLGIRETPVLTTPVSVIPGVYYFLIVTNGSCGITGFNNTISPLCEIFGTSGIATNAFIGGLLPSFIYGSTPNPITLPDMNSTNTPVVNYRVSSLP